VNKRIKKGLPSIGLYTPKMGKRAMAQNRLGWNDRTIIASATWHHSPTRSPGRDSNRTPSQEFDGLPLQQQQHQEKGFSHQRSTIARKKN